MIYKLFDLYYSIEFIYPFSKHLLAPYLTNDDKSPDEIIKITNQEIESEFKNDPEHQKDYHEFVCIFRHISKSIINYNGLFIHSAVIEMNGYGYMFSGKSGAGKSTHIKQWADFFGADKVKIINGDKPIVRFFDDGIYAYGNPWHGVEGWSNNSKVKLNSVCFIEQATTNSIRTLRPDEVLKRMLNQTIMPKDTNEKLKYFDLMDKLIKSLNFYELNCDISKDAVLTAYNEMRGDKIE